MSTVPSVPAAPPRRAPRDLGLVLLGVALALPRLVGAFGPSVWVDDEPYVAAARLMASGRVPHVDFHLQHVPLLEAVMAAGFAIFGVSLRVPELLTQAAYLVASILAFSIGCRLGGRVAGVAAAIVFAWSPVVLLCDLFPREAFVALFALLAVRVALSAGAADARAGSRLLLLAGALGGLAVLSKLTAIGCLLGLVAAELVTSRRPRRVVAIGLGATALIAPCYLGLAALFGNAFVGQVLLFGMLAPRQGSLAEKWQHFAPGIGLPLALAVPGLLVVLLARQGRDWAHPIAQLIGAFAFTFLLKPIAWLHNGIELAPWIALLAGAFIAHAAGAAADLLAAGRERRRLPGRALATVGAGGLVAALLATLAVPEAGGVDWDCRRQDRAGLLALADVVRSGSRPDDVVHVAQIVALAADRDDLIHYLEIDGQLDDMARATERAGIAGAWRELRARRREHINDVVDAAIRAKAPLVLEAVRSQRVAVIMTHDPQHECTPAGIQLDPRALAGFGYRPLAEGDGWTLWGCRSPR